MRLNGLAATNIQMRLSLHRGHTIQMVVVSQARSRLFSRRHVPISQKRKKRRIHLNMKKNQRRLKHNK